MFRRAGDLCVKLRIDERVVEQAELKFYTQDVRHGAIQCFGFNFPSLIPWTIAF